jgi:hypothetical protein
MGIVCLQESEVTDQFMYKVTSQDQLYGSISHMEWLMIKIIKYKTIEDTDFKYKMKYE